MSNTAERQVLPEITIPPSEFVDRIYKSSIEKYSSEEGAKVIANIQNVREDNWDSVTPHPQGPSVGLPADILEAIVIENGDFVRAFIMSERNRTRYDREKTKSFQFGIFSSKSVRDWTDTKNLRLFTMNGMGTYHAGEIYVDDYQGKINTDGWADGQMYGGKDLRSWDKNNQLTHKGLEEAENFVDRTFRNSTIAEDVIAAKRKEEM